MPNLNSQAALSIWKDNCRELMKYSTLFFFFRKCLEVPINISNSVFQQMSSKILDILKITTKALSRLSSHKCKIYWILYDDIFVAPVRILHFLPTNLEKGGGLNLKSLPRKSLWICTVRLSYWEKRGIQYLYIFTLFHRQYFTECVSSMRNTVNWDCITCQHIIVSSCDIFLLIQWLFWRCDSQQVILLWGWRAVIPGRLLSWAGIQDRQFAGNIEVFWGFFLMLFTVPYSIVFISLLCFSCGRVFYFNSWQQGEVALLTFLHWFFLKWVWYF
jgi:hypothetical protein